MPIMTVSLQGNQCIACTADSRTAAQEGEEEGRASWASRPVQANPKQCPSHNRRPGCNHGPGHNCTWLCVQLHGD